MNIDKEIQNIKNISTDIFRDTDELRLMIYGAKAGHKIYVIDDEETELKIISRILKGQKRPVVTCKNYMQLLGGLTEDDVALVVTDFCMAPRDGMHVIEALSGSAIKCIVVSGLPEHSPIIAQVKSLGVNFISKDDLGSKLINSIEDLLGPA